MMLGRLAGRVGRVIPSLVSARQIAPTTSVLAHSEKHLARTLFGQKFEVGEIQAYKRTVTGSRNAQWARQNQLIPGIIYGYDADGRDTTELVYVKEADLRTQVNKFGRSFMNSLFDIVVDGKKQRVLARDFQLHPFRPKAISINWLRYRPGAYPGAKLDIPLKPFNEERCPAYKEGGWLLQLVDKIPVYASGPELPDALMMDLRGLVTGDKVMASQVEMNEGLTLRSKVRDFAVAKFVGSRRGAGGDEEKDGKKAGGADDKKKKEA